jgi:hypothetical protein
MSLYLAKCLQASKAGYTKKITSKTPATGHVETPSRPAGLPAFGEEAR